MPIYIYECNDCGLREDYLVKADQRPDGCYDCGSVNLERVFDGQTVSGRTGDKSGMHLPTSHYVPKEIGIAGKVVHKWFEGNELKGECEHPLIGIKMERVTPRNN